VITPAEKEADYCLVASMDVVFDPSLLSVAS
jgi:hypothetical protein